jgi:RHS repeat-associated protein
LTRGLDLSGTLQGAGGIGGLLAMTDSSGANYYYHEDAVGSVTALMDAYENIVGRRTYDAFGRTLRLTGSKTGVNPFWYSSQLHDEDTDFYHYKHRVYLTYPTRWASNDPNGEPGFELIRHRKANALAGGPNRYEFVHNNPINKNDPLGLADIYDDFMGTYVPNPRETDANGNALRGNYYDQAAGDLYNQYENAFANAAEAAYVIPAGVVGTVEGVGMAAKGTTICQRLKGAVTAALSAYAASEAGLKLTGNDVPGNVSVPANTAGTIWDVAKKDWTNVAADVEGWVRTAINYYSGK